MTSQIILGRGQMMDRISKLLILTNSINVSLLAFGNLPLIPALLVTAPIGALLVYIFAIDLDKKSINDDSEATLSSQNDVMENSKIDHEPTMTLAEIFNEEEIKKTVIASNNNKKSSVRTIELRHVKLSPEVVAAREKASQKRRSMTATEISREREKAYKERMR